MFPCICAHGSFVTDGRLSHVLTGFINPVTHRKKEWIGSLITGSSCGPYPLFS